MKSTVTHEQTMSHAGHSPQEYNPRNAFEQEHGLTHTRTQLNALGQLSTLREADSLLKPLGTCGSAFTHSTEQGPGQGEWPPEVQAS